LRRLVGWLDSCRNGPSNTNETRNVTDIKKDERVFRCPVVAGCRSAHSQSASRAAHRGRPAERLGGGLRRWVVEHCARRVRCSDTRTRTHICIGTDPLSNSDSHADSHSGTSAFSHNFVA